MQIAPHITIRDLPDSPALEAHILNKINKLEQFCGKITHCDVVLEQVQKHKHQGTLYRANISMTVPNGEIVINHPNNEDVYVAIRDSFKAARRRLQSLLQKQRGAVKTHDPVCLGTVAYLNREERYGFIAQNDEEYYFSDNNMRNGDFDKLALGSSVQFIEGLAASDGLQANQVIRR